MEAGGGETHLAGQKGGHFGLQLLRHLGHERVVLGEDNLRQEDKPPPAAKGEKGR